MKLDKSLTHDPELRAWALRLRPAAAQELFRLEGIQPPEADQPHIRSQIDYLRRHIRELDVIIERN